MDGNTCLCPYVSGQFTTVHYTIHYRTHADICDHCLTCTMSWWKVCFNSCHKEIPSVILTHCLVDNTKRLVYILLLLMHLPNFILQINEIFHRKKSFPIIIINYYMGTELQSTSPSLIPFLSVIVFLFMKCTISFGFATLSTNF